MADERKEYDVDIAGVSHTMLLTDDDAKRFGDAAQPAKAAAKPTNKSRTAANKSKG